MRQFFRFAALIASALLLSGFTECYKPVSKTQLPPHIKTVAVPAFQLGPEGLRFKIEQRFTQAVMTELIRRGHGLRVQSEREGADAVIDGVRPLVFDPSFSCTSTRLPKPRFCTSV